MPSTQFQHHEPKHLSHKTFDRYRPSTIIEVLSFLAVALLAVWCISIFNHSDTKHTGYVQSTFSYQEPRSNVTKYGIVLINKATIERVQGKRVIALNTVSCGDVTKESAHTASLGSRTSLKRCAEVPSGSKVSMILTSNNVNQVVSNTIDRRFKNVANLPYTVHP